MLACPLLCASLFLFFFNDTATTEIYTLSLHDALPIELAWRRPGGGMFLWARLAGGGDAAELDRKSTRLNSGHVEISYAGFCLKKKKNHIHYQIENRNTKITGHSCIFREIT